MTDHPLKSAAMALTAWQFGIFDPPTFWGESTRALIEANWRRFLPMTAVAVRALREPDIHAWAAGCRRRQEGGTLRQQWQSMIDALTEDAHA
jgi:hypothetical protein